MTYNTSPNGSSWWRRLSEGSRIALIAAMITGVLGILGTIIGVLLTNSNSNGSTSPGSSSSATVPSASTNGSSAGGGSSAGTAFTAAYQNSRVVIQTMPGGACGYGESVNINKPSVDPSNTNGDSFSFDSDNCANWSFQVGLANQATGSMPSPASQAQDNPTACLKAIASDPNPQSDKAKTGDAFCVQSADNFIAYVKIISVDSQGNVTLRLNGWSTS